MVRATRSTVALQNQQQESVSKKQSKKRKRGSMATEPDDQRAAKHSRTEQKRDEELPGMGDMLLDHHDAAKILDVLEMIDTQGLLDRVFPLPDSDASSSSKASSSKDVIKTYSLRALLKDSAIHPLRVLRSAIQPLFPISSHPRSRPSVTAAQQLHFCNLALSLLDQASSHNRPALALSQSTLFPDPDPEPEPAAVGSSDKRRRYALVQKLPAGEWWSSSNTSREAEDGLTAAEAKEMRKGQAELVSIIPTLPLLASSMPTLGELQMEGRKEPKSRFKPLHMHPRPLSSGTFLDYGPHTSFAPAFDSEGAEVGRDGLGQVLISRLERRKVKEARRKLVAKLQAEQMEDVPVPEVEVTQGREATGDILLSLFPDEKMDGFKTALRELELEEGVASLLEKNAHALERLNLLQTARLRAGNSQAKEGSEEWNTAREIMASLTLLASLRPRSSTSRPEDSTPSHPPLIPPLSVIRALHATLPAGPTQGWQGTLDETRKTALRDDTTIRVKAGAPQPVAQPAAAAPPQPFGTPGQNNPYRPAGPFPFPHAPAQAQARPPATPQTQTQSTYYPNAYLQNQGSGAASAPQYQYQGQYSYPPAWYGYQQQSAQKATAASGAPFYNYVPQQAGGTPRAVVGNTAKPQQAQQNGWAQGYGQNQAAATLPPHLRRAGTSTPGSPAHGYAPYHPYVPPVQAQNGAGR